MSIIALHDEDIIAKIIKDYWHDNDDRFMPPMFHGTDESLLYISQQDRELLHKACEEIISSIYFMFVEKSVDINDERLLNSKDNRGDSLRAYTVYADGRIKNSPLYSYGNFYLTNEPLKALGYSRQSGILGESGWIANRLVIGAQEIGIELPHDKTFLNALKVINQRKKMVKFHKPIILMVVNLKSSECCYENGETMYPGKELSFFMRWIKEKNPVMSLRLKNIDNINNLSAFMIRECDYAKLINAWNAK